MLTSLSFIFLVGLAMAAICQRIRLPRIIGMLLTGIVLGPYVLDILDPSILSISSELRQMALIIILVKAGLSLNLADLKKVGRPAVMLSCVPASFELLEIFTVGTGDAKGVPRPVVNSTICAPDTARAVAATRSLPGADRRFNPFTFTGSA